jgi:hypothetical protein
MNYLGQIMLDRGWITESQLQQAIERQQQLGGRLGTCLLELGFIDEQFLLQALSDQLGAPVATAQDLHEIAPEALGLLPKEFAIRNRAVPFRVAGGTVDLAMLDVGDLTVEDELSFIVSKRIRFHVATELRLVEALARYYGCDIPLRLSTLARHLSAPAESELQPAATAEKAGARKVFASPPSTLPDLQPARRVRSAPTREVPASIPLTKKERAALTEVRAREPQLDTTEQDDLTMELVRAETSSDIGHVFLQVLSRHFVRTLLFRVSGSRQEITGWLSQGPDIDTNWFENYSIGLRQSSIFRQLLSTREVFIGRLEPHPCHAALARCWGGSLEYEGLFIPVFVRKRLVCVAYCDRSSLGISNLDLALIKGLRNKVAIAFERCILRRKLQSVD